ncbi:hypothetical protein [Embleya sp. NPDC005575]|uniref:hypothetical protein n=1 Tax=Embleya sp. NPDC005575 TaxID=3156892 RepID=UPI0033AB48AD
MLTEDRFKEMLRAELGARPAPMMPDVAPRAAERGRRRARRRTAGRLLGATLAGAVIATGIVGASSLRPGNVDVAGPAATMRPSLGSLNTTGTNPLLPAQPVAKNPYADWLPGIIEELLPPGAKTAVPDTGVDGGIYVSVEWETGQGLVQLLFGVTGKRWFGCTTGEGGRPQARPNDGVQCSVTPDGALLGRYERPSTDAGVAWRRFEYVTRESMVTLSYANGPLSSVAKPTRATLPLTDEEALALLKNPRWQQVLDKYTAPPAAPAPYGSTTAVPLVPFGS